MYCQRKLTEPYGHGVEISKEICDKIIRQTIHHQYKYLAIHGVLLVQVFIFHYQSKQMELYGHGVIIIPDNWVKIID